METKVVNDVTLTRKLTFNDSVIEKIAGLVCRNVEGVLSLDGGMMSELADRSQRKLIRPRELMLRLVKSRWRWIWMRQSNMG